MASGPLVQLVSVGDENDALNGSEPGNPAISFFQMNYHRHTNFSTSTQPQVTTGNAEFGGYISCTLSNNADMIQGLMLKFTLPAIHNGSINTLMWSNSIGHAIIESAEVRIGGKLIEKTYGEWMEIWTELAMEEDKQYGYRQMIGKYHSKLSLEYSSSEECTYYVPMNFWFCKHPGMSLPILALQNQDVEVHIRFNRLSKLIEGSGDLVDISGKQIQLKNVELHADVIFLDETERRAVAVQPQHYLIEQLQRNTFIASKGISSLKVPLDFGHPCKELIWVIKPDNGKLFSCNEETHESFESAKLSFNGHSCFDSREAKYFRIQQVQKHHTRVPKQYIYCYSFGLRPEQHQPTGTCNFSRIENAILSFDFGTAQMSSNIGKVCNVYATNYNVLCIESGLGEIKFRM